MNYCKSFADMLSLLGFQLERVLILDSVGKTIDTKYALNDLNNKDYRRGESKHVTLYESAAQIIKDIEKHIDDVLVTHLTTELKNKGFSSDIISNTEENQISYKTFTRIKHAFINGIKNYDLYEDERKKRQDFYTQNELYFDIFEAITMYRTSIDLNAVLNITSNEAISVIGLPSNIENALFRRNICTIQQLINMTESEVKKVRNIGDAKLEIIKETLKKHNMQLKANRD